MLSRDWLPIPLNTEFIKLAESTRLWVVGGAVRDALLQRPTLDFDFVVAGQARRFARRVADALGAHYYDLDAERDVGRVIHGQPDGSQRCFDFAALREKSIEDDLWARDFTINAMAVALDQPQCVLDPTGGRRDLKAGLLRSCTRDALARDPVRTLRAVRLAHDLDLTIDRRTMRQVARHASRLAGVSAERIRDELMCILELPRPAPALRTLEQLSLLRVVLPEVARARKIAGRFSLLRRAHRQTFAAVDCLSALLDYLAGRRPAWAKPEPELAEAALRLGRFGAPLQDRLQSMLTKPRRLRSLLFLAALYHGLGPSTLRSRAEPPKPGASHPDLVAAETARSRARALRLSNDEVSCVAGMVRWRGQLEPLALPLAPRDIYRFFHRARDAGVEVVLLGLAEALVECLRVPQRVRWSKTVEAARTLYEAYFEQYLTRIDPVPLLRGDELAHALELSPGAQIGQLLELIREAQAAGEVKTREQALSLARGCLQVGSEGERQIDCGLAASSIDQDTG